MSIRVRNINGTSQLACKCGSWLDHWKRFSGRALPVFCAEVSCREKPEVGAHVQKDYAFDSDWYIIPLCKGHNLTASSLDIMSDTVLVPANVSKTCG
jgi:hypothetical protein